MNGMINLVHYSKYIDELSYKIAGSQNAGGPSYIPTNINPNTNIIYLQRLGFQLTEACNLNCTYCYQVNKTPKTLKFESVKRLIDIVFGDADDCDKFGTFILQSPFNFYIIGGESFFYPKLAYDTIKYFADKLKSKKVKIDWDIWISTNGLNYDNEYVQKIIAEFKDHLNMQVSVDGCEKCHNTCRITQDGKGSYDLANYAFQKYRRQRPELYHMVPTKFTIAPENLQYFEESIMGWINDDVRNLYFNWACEREYTDDQAREYYNSGKNIIDYIINNDLEDKVLFAALSRGDDSYFPAANDFYVCGGGGNGITLDPSGNLVPCERFASASLNKDQKIFFMGNINDGIAYDDETMYNFSHMQITRSTGSNYKCYNCPYDIACSQCAALDFATGGWHTEMRNTNVCKMQIADQLLRAYGVNKIYRKKENKDVRYFFKTFHILVPRDDAAPIIGNEEYDNIKYLAKEYDL